MDFSTAAYKAVSYMGQRWYEDCTLIEDENNGAVQENSAGVILPPNGDHLQPGILQCVIAN